MELSTWGTGERMVTARNLAIVATAAGVLAGMPWSKAQACDNDRFPCPILSEAPGQDSADAAPAAPPQQSKKKPTQAGEKPASAKGERDNAQAAARPPSKQSGQDNAKRAAKPGKPAPHEQANAAGAPPVPAVQVASPVPVIPEQLHNAATDRANSAPVPTRDASANAEGASRTPG